MRRQRTGEAALHCLDQLKTKVSTTGQVFTTLLYAVPWWQEREREARQRATAVMLYAGEIALVEAKIGKGELAWESLPELANRVTLWQEGLPEGARCFLPHKS